MKNIIRDILSRDSLYAWLGGVIFVCSLLAVADFLGLYEATTAELATYFVMVIAAGIGRAAIRVNKRKQANAEKANKHNDTSVES